MTLIGKRPRAVMRIDKPTATQRLLNRPHSLRILAGPKPLPLLFQSAIQTRWRSGMRAEEGNDDSGIDENDGVCEDDERWSGCAAFGLLLSSLLHAVEVVSEFEEESGDDGEGCC